MMMSDDEANPKLLHLFAAETQDAVQIITQHCLLLEQQPGTSNQSDLLTDILRQTHNLKGAARALGLEEIGLLTHRLETLFEGIKDAGVKPETAVFDLMYLVLDNISRLIKGTIPADVPVNDLLNKLETAGENVRAWMTDAATQPSPAETPPLANPAPDSEETIRITVGRLDAILNLVNELRAAQLGQEHSLAEMRHLLYDSAPTVSQPGEFSPLRTQFNELYRRSAANHRHLSQLLAQLQENVRQARMWPLAAVFAPLPRFVRDLAREFGKEVTFHVEGNDIKLDRSVLEQIKSPLRHLLNNAVSHGLETPEKRRAAGKPEAGRITVTAVQRGSSIFIEISDDGAGIDLVHVKEQAVRRGLLTAESAEQLDEQETIWLLFQPGFSLASAVTAVSGRGVGLDTVRQAVESMHGTIFVENRPGQGMRFSLSLPVSIATSLCLLVRANSQIFALPARNVTRLTRTQPGQIQRDNGRLLLVRPGEEPMPAVSLTHSLLFNGRSPDLLPTEDCQIAVLIEPAEQPVALLVDELHEVQEIVIKKLPPPFSHMPYIFGASILGTGTVILVLNVTDLIRAAK